MYSININSPECCCLALFQYTMLVCVWLTQCCSIIIYYHGAIFNVGLHNLSGYLMCVCVCLSVWYSSSAPTASSFGPSVNKDYQETAQWKMHLGVFFFPPQSQRGGLMCSSATTQRRAHHSVWASHRRPQKEIHFTLAVTCVSCPFEMDDSSYSHRRLCRGGVRSCARGCVCSACVCVCAGMGGRAHEGRDGRAAEIIHFVRRQDKCRESRFSHFLLPCLSLVLFLGPVFCIVVIRPTACESISTQ